MNATLENWYSSESPKIEKVYTSASSNWNAYLYTDGSTYVRGSSSIYSSSLTYKNGTSVKTSGTTVWFKVEPIRWVVLNYDEVSSGTATSINCVSEISLCSNIQYNSNQVDDANKWGVSKIRTWLNSKFYEEVFTKEQKNNIFPTSNSTTLTSGESLITEDYIYLLSKDYINSSAFSSAKTCAPSDFVLSNYCNATFNASYPTRTRSDGLGCIWWTSTGSGTESVYVVYGTGFCSTNSVIQKGYTIRPAISFKI